MRGVGLVLALCLMATVVLGQCVNDCSDRGACVYPGDCVCYTGWGGVDCSIADDQIISGSTVADHLNTYSWHYYNINLDEADTSLVIDLAVTSTLGDIDLYVGLNTYPTSRSYFYKDGSSEKVVHAEVPVTEAGTYYVGLYGYWDADYEMTVQSSVGCSPACSEFAECINQECACFSPYVGETCDIYDMDAVSGETYESSVASSSYKYYNIDVADGQSLSVVLSELSQDSDLDLFIKLGARPTYFNFDYVNNGFNQVSTLYVDAPEAGHYEIGVFGYQSGSYNITIEVSDPGAGCFNSCSGVSHGICAGQRCTCLDDFSGESCNTYDANMQLRNDYSGLVETSYWNYWHVNFFTSSSLAVTLRQISDGDCDLYIRNGALPTITQFDLQDWSRRTTVTLTIRNPGTDTWYIGVFGYAECTYTIEVDEVMECACGGGGHGSCPQGSSECVCNIGFAGEECEDVSTPVLNGQVLSYQYSAAAEWTYYYMVATTSMMSVTMVESDTEGMLWLFVSLEGYPTLQNYAYDDREEGSFHEVHIQTNEVVEQAFFIGVYGSPYASGGVDIEYQLTAWYPDFLE